MTLPYTEVPLQEIICIRNQDLYKRKTHWHEHMNRFSEASLKHLCSNRGFEVTDIKVLEVHDSPNIAHRFQIVCGVKSD